jgi:hypothetical protein
MGPSFQPLSTEVEPRRILRATILEWHEMQSFSLEFLLNAVGISGWSVAYPSCYSSLPRAADIHASEPVYRTLTRWTLDHG